MIDRRVEMELQDALRRQTAVALIGLRQLGTTTLALSIGKGLDALYFDVENPDDRAKLTDPVYFLGHYFDRLVVLDEIHRVPALFPLLRGMIGEGRRTGRGKGRNLLLGSASLDLPHQSGESLAGRIVYVNLGPFDVLGVDGGRESVTKLWVRGGLS